MLTFNDVLHLEGIDPADVRLARHRDGRLRPGRLYETWLTNRGDFEAYQSVQAREVFPVGSFVASFIVTEAGRTVFVGLYSVNGRGFCPEGTVDPLVQSDVSGHIRYDLRLCDEMADYRDRVVIEWGAGKRSWVQRAANQSKPVREIAQQHEPPFPGFRTFVRPVDDIPTLPHGWQQVLRSVKGVYLLVDTETGDQYVGSAKGADSLFGRWLAYANGGDGGDEGLKHAAKAGRRHYQVSVLEVVDENTPDVTIEQIESSWKTKLLTRRPLGLNWN